MVFAQIKDGIVQNTITINDISLLGLFQNDPNGNPYDLILQVDNKTPQPGIGWTFDNVNWSPPKLPSESKTTLEIYTGLVQAAINFGNTIIVQFATQNVMSGITQAGKTLPLLGYCSNLYLYLSSGSLYVAISELQRMIDDTSDDKAELAPFITNSILYSYMNKIQSYLGISLTPNPDG